MRWPVPEATCVAPVAVVSRTSASAGPRGWKRSASLGTTTTPGCSPVMISTLAVIPGKRRPSGLSPAITTVKVTTFCKETGASLICSTFPPKLTSG